MVCSRYRTHGCPCGYFNDPNKTCKCHPQQIDRYLARISGPLIDRIDIHIEVPVVPYRELRSTRDGTSSTDMRQKVLDARERQRRRFDSTKLKLNNQMTGREIRKHCKLDTDCEGLLRQAMTQLGLSARAHDKILRVSRTIADLDASEPIQPQHITEAIHYRRLDRQL
ncbi:MAG: ATP-binding protein [Planctomycetes bacterium]|nr:ATP-binding protein [Planctomycetota bacterium]